MDRSVRIEKSVADRTITSKKNGARTGVLIDPFRRRKVWYESGLEAAWLQVLIADPTVFDIREQQLLRIPYKGQPVKHYFDAVVTRTNGRRSAIAMKYRKDRTSDLDGMLRAAAETIGDTFADEWCVKTERNLTRTMIRNAGRIISCGLDFDYEAQDALAAALGRYGPDIVVADCDAILGDGERGSRAAMALIQTGKLQIRHGDRLQRETVLRNLFTN